MVDLARQIHQLILAGGEVILVSSGAIAAGRELLNFPHLPKDIPAKQMLAAVGQPRLMDLWGKFFEIYGLRVAQVLLTRTDLGSRSGYLNARNALLALLKQGVLPIVNENDTVATEEIRVGDNDNLSGLVANLIDADLLVLLTDREGLFTADPGLDPSARLITLVETQDISPELWEAAGGSGGQLGVGGMTTKLQAADLARRSGANVIIASGSIPEILGRIVENEPIGTRFTPITSSVESRKRFILSGGKAGKLVIDIGAAEALARGGSLLPVGLKGVSGTFSRGANLSVCNEEDQEIGRGLVNYNHHDCTRLRGLKSHEIEAILGYFYGEEIIHRSNLVLL
jgi:glutamate 5-kinase